MNRDSVLGPLLFALFISPVANVINSDLAETNNLVSFHQYADDTQLYIGTNASTLVHKVASIESCTQRVHNWLLNSGLHLNQGLTKKRLERDQMALGVFPNCHECQKIDFPVLKKKPSAIYKLTENPGGFGNSKNIRRRSVALRHVTPCWLLRLKKPHIILSKLIISQTNCKIN